MSYIEHVVSAIHLNVRKHMVKQHKKKKQSCFVRNLDHMLSEVHLIFYKVFAKNQSKLCELRVIALHMVTLHDLENLNFRDIF